MRMFEPPPVPAAGVAIREGSAGVSRRLRVANGKVVRSSLEGDADPLEFIPRMLAMAEELDLDRLITPYPFDQINEAIADSASGKVVKPVLVW